MLDISALLAFPPERTVFFGILELLEQFHARAGDRYRSATLESRVGARRGTLVDFSIFVMHDCYASPVRTLINDANGWGGIRTPGAFRHTRFPGVHNQPLCHPSKRRTL
jgi:hypothetical protein